MTKYNELLFFTLTILVFSCTEKERTKPMIRSITESVYASGNIKSEGQYHVITEVNGTISQIHVKEGDIVKSGDLLISLHNLTSDLQKENAELVLKEIGENERKLEDLKREINLAFTQSKQDSIMLERQKALWAQNIGSKTELEQRELIYHASKTKLKNLRNQLSLSKAELEIRKQEARNNLRITKDKNANYQIRSKIDGKVYKILPKTGESVTAMSKVAIVGDEGKFLAEMQVDEFDIGKIKEGQKVFVRMDSYPDSVFTASIKKIYPYMDEKNMTFRVDAEFENMPPRMFPNQTLEANILVAAKDSALLIPRSYLVDDSFVITEKSERIVVKTGVKNFEYVEILEGLNPEQYIYKP
ncbi:MAG: efflux RND transporter periplasmic adaptor subunit [Cytophagaceae bacterium]